MNRRQKLPDGRTIIGINPGGVIDRAVDVIRLDDCPHPPGAVKRP